ncbi:hypothetical protein JOD97_001056 [Duganella sp. 1411]|uniref:hypothetical protein n=1 Tax=Duganella sp. 1411 TaxID=2806572 RepID=UPI001AE95390|nr:hypothetical protein [Duganella sp. 1411]MBP1203042.1 hypothetical protein [Duganella sp. 1411]
MTKSTPPSKPPVRIVCSSEFSQNASTYLNPAEYRALFLLLGEESKLGEPVGDLPGLRGLDYAGTIIHYLLPPDHGTVYLIRIERVDWDARSPAAREKRLLRAALSLATKGVVVIAVRGGLKWLWDLIGH